MLINSKDARRQLLRFLAGKSSSDEVSEEALPYLMGWLVKAKLGAAAYSFLSSEFPEVQMILQGVYYTNVYRDTVQRKAFVQMAEQLDPAKTEIVLLKGLAISPLVWDETYLRFKADVDFLVKRQDLQAVHNFLHEMKFTYKKPDKIKAYFPDLPPTNKEGQIEMVSPTIDRVQVEAHTEVFIGHVQRLTNRRIEAELWERKVPADIHIIPAGGEAEARFWRLSNEDLAIHTMLHTAINHQFDPNTLRNMVDLLRLDDRLHIDWNLVYERVNDMRSRTAIWLFLHLTAEIFGAIPADMNAVYKRLKPTWLRRKLLNRLIDADKLLNLYDILISPKRYGLLLLLIDRPIDMLKVLTKLPQLLDD